MDNSETATTSQFLISVRPLVLTLFFINAIYAIWTLT
jgi:hypothetical protein